MQKNRFGRRSYATAVATDDISDSSAPGVSPRLSMANRAVNEGRNLRKEAENKKRYFQQKLNLEGNRKKLGKGNIITFLINDENQGIEKNKPSFGSGSCDDCQSSLETKEKIRLRTNERTK